MLYVGHFSFDETNITGLARHGYFTMVVSGETAEDAVAAFKAAIKAHRGENPIFDAITAVYIEDIVEIPAVSANPIMTRLQSSAGEFPESVSHSLPGVKQEGVKAYGFAIDVMQIRTQPTHSYKEMTPFIRF
ncbi:MAG: hypothetical protein PVJ53_00685 [Desulfobacterales bacterium]|jgi:hypothetical protein